MRKLNPVIPLLLIVACCAFSGGLGAEETSAPASMQTEPSSMRDAPDETNRDAPWALPGSWPMAMRDRLVQVMAGWSPAVIPSSPVDDVAVSITRAVLRDASSDPWQDAVLLVAIAYFEGARFAVFVDSGECNDHEWRAWGVEEELNAAGVGRVWTSQELMHVGGDCDGGRAYSFWQIHPAWDRSSPLYADCRKDTVTGDRADAAFCALRLARSDPSLCGYTGEVGDYCPKAEQRLAFARRSLDAFPFSP